MHHPRFQVDVLGGEAQQFTRRKPSAAAVRTAGRQYAPIASATPATWTGVHGTIRTAGAAGIFTDRAEHGFAVMRPSSTAAVMMPFSTP
jgi:hypothetical protein